MGYADQSAFRRLFLRIVGMTPANYRRHVNCKRRERPLMPSVAGSLRGLQASPECSWGGVRPDHGGRASACNQGVTL